MEGLGHSVVEYLQSFPKGKVTEEEIQAALNKLKAAIEEAGKPIETPVENPPKVNEAFAAADGLKYKVTAYSSKSKSVTVTGSAKKLTALTIPATVRYKNVTFKVTSIGKKAFSKQKKLKSLTIGKNVKSIGANAFSGDKKLAKIKFSGTAIKSIGKNAFKNIKKNAAFSVKKSKKAYYKRLLQKAKTKNFKVK